MDKNFNYKEKEEKIYKNWEEKGYFKPVIDKDKKPFVISMPPPNVTAKLHIGHALDDTIQDVLIRYHRMLGDPTLYVPGTDHASIATEVKVVEKLKKEGKTVYRYWNPLPKNYNEYKFYSRLVPIPILP